MIADASRLRALAALALERDLGDENFDLDSVVRVETYIERLRAGEVPPHGTVDETLELLGAYLGECLLHEYGGDWTTRDGQDGVRFHEDLTAFPFAKVEAV